MSTDFHIDDTPMMMKRETDELISLRDEVVKLKQDLASAQDTIKNKSSIIEEIKFLINNI